MSKFKVGEVVIMMPRTRTDLRGKEATVLGINDKGDGYYLDVPNDVGYVGGWAEQSLRKKKPPQREKTTTWESMKDIWTPDEVSA